MTSPSACPPAAAGAILTRVTGSPLRVPIAGVVSLPAAETLFRDGQFAEAIEECDRLIACNGADITALHLAAAASLSGRRYTEAVRYGSAALKELASHPASETLYRRRFLLSLCVIRALCVLARHEEALAIAFDVHCHAPATDPTPCYLVARVYWEMGKEAACREWTARGMSRPHETVAHHRWRQSLRAMLGEPVRAEARSAQEVFGNFRVIGPTAPAVPRPRSPEWRGQPMPRGVLLLRRMGAGLGDLIMAAQCIAAISERARRVIVETPPALWRLFTSSFRHLPNVLLWDPALGGEPTHDVWVGSFELLSLVGVTPATERGPALIAPPGSPLSLGAGPQVGIVWAVAQGSETIDERGMPLAVLVRSLSAVPNVTIHSLQGPVPASDAVASYPAVRQHVVRDLGDTASVIAHLDAVVSIDAGVCHLSAALGVPTFTLLNRSADWRWGHDSETTAWYPSMRLIRQSANAGWGTIARQAAELIRADALPLRRCSPRPGRAAALREDASVIRDAAVDRTH